MVDGPGRGEIDAFPWWRASLTWMLIILVETLHGMAREVFIAPLLGDLRARQLGVLVGCVLIRSAISDELQCGLAGMGGSVGNWIKTANALNFDHLRLTAAMACVRVGAEGSELFELWNEDPDMGSSWNAQVKELAEWLNAG